MTKTRPGADRIARQSLQAVAVAAERQRAMHVKHCPQCQRANGDLRACCLEWWNLSITAHRARRKLRQYAQPETANINPLPGME